MPSFLEVCRRAQTGPLVEEQDFDLDRVHQTANELCGRYDIKYDPAAPVPSDDDLADRVYQAAVDFFCEVGVYCSDTHRVIRFSRDEVLEAVRLSAGQCIMGEGQERGVFTSRKPDSNTRPWYHVGSGIINSDERIVSNLVRAYADNRQANSISIPALLKMEGLPIEAGTPSEVLASIRGIQLGRDALRQAGRPGLPIANCISTAGTSLASVAASAPQFGLRPSDGWLIPAMAEMKVKLETLNKAAYLLSWGANMAGESGPLVGGYAGGPAETAVLTTAYTFLGLLLFRCRYHLMFPTHIIKSCSTARDVLWTVAVSAQAIARNTREPVLTLGYMAAGPMTREFFYEAAAHIAAVMASGTSPQTAHPAKAILDDYVTPMEMKGSVEITEACTGMKRSEANEIVNALLLRYENTLDRPPQGSRYQDCHDVETGKPCQEYVDLYGEVMEELRSLGIPVPGN